MFISKAYKARSYGATTIPWETFQVVAEALLRERSGDA
jgi:hypothetical protein